MTNYNGTWKCIYCNATEGYWNACRHDDGYGCCEECNTSRIGHDMCVVEDCGQYKPNLSQIEQEGQDCAGVGREPDCLNCDQSYNKHLNTFNGGEEFIKYLESLPHNIDNDIVY